MERINTVKKRVEELFPERDIDATQIIQIPESGNIVVNIQYVVGNRYAGKQIIIRQDDDIDVLLNNLSEDVRRIIDLSRKDWIVNGPEFTQGFINRINYISGNAERLCHALNLENFLIRFYEDFKNSKVPPIGHASNPEVRDPRRAKYIRDKMTSLYGSEQGAYAEAARIRHERWHRIMHGDNAVVLVPADEETEEL